MPLAPPFESYLEVACGISLNWSNKLKPLLVIVFTIHGGFREHKRLAAATSVSGNNDLLMGH